MDFNVKEEKLETLLFRLLYRQDMFDCIADPCDKCFSAILDWEVWLMKKGIKFTFMKFIRYYLNYKNSKFSDYKMEQRNIGFKFPLPKTNL